MQIISNELASQNLYPSKITGSSSPMSVWIESFLTGKRIRIKNHSFWSVYQNVNSAGNPNNAKKIDKPRFYNLNVSVPTGLIWLHQCLKKTLTNNKKKIRFEEFWLRFIHQRLDSPEKQKKIGYN